MYITWHCHVLHVTRDIAEIGNGPSAGAESEFVLAAQEPLDTSRRHLSVGSRSKARGCYLIELVLPPAKSDARGLHRLIASFHKKRLHTACGPTTVAAHGLTSGIGGGGALGGGQNASDSHNATPATSPIRSSVHALALTPGAVGVSGRKRNVVGAGFDSSPGSINDDDDAEEKKRQPVKRACNECRQQKVSVSALFLPSLLLYGAKSVLNSCDAT